nr:hypothetical protein [Tanacetum cinerariifolium]
MMTARKRVGPLPVQQLAMRRSVDHSSSNSSSRHSLSDHSSPDLPSTSARPSRTRRRSPMASVPALPPVMATSVILISSDSSEDSIGTPVGRVILFGTIPTTIPDTTPVIALPTTQTDITVIPAETPIVAPNIPPSPDYTPASLDYSPASEAESDPSKDPSSGHIPPLPARSPVIPRRRVMILAPGQPIPHGRPYRYHPNGPVHMMTAIKGVRPLHVLQLSMRHSVNHSSLDSSSRHSSSDHSSLDLPSISAGPFHKRRRSLMTSVPALPLVFEALSPICVHLIPLLKRVKDIGYLADVEVDPRETKVVRVTHPAMPEDIPEPAQEGAV